MNEPRTPRRMPYGELIAFAALIVSAIGVWIAWKATTNDQPTRVVEQRAAIPLTLRAKVEDDGRRLEITPVEPTHALESLVITIDGAKRIEIGSDGVLTARDVESALRRRDEAKGSHSRPVPIEARYIEAGRESRGSGMYVLRYRWEDGGLLGGRSLRLVGLSRS